MPRHGGAALAKVHILPDKTRSPGRSQRTRARRACRVATVLGIALTATLGASQKAPPLPRLAIDTYPPAARDPIVRVHQMAAARPADAGAAGALARVLQAWEQWDGAHEAYLRAQALAPDVFDWHYLDAVVLERLARHAEAAVQLTRALTVSPAYLPARVKLADALLDAGDLDGSRRQFEALVREPAAEPAAELGLGRIAAARGHHDVAVTHLEHAVALFPEFGAAYYLLARAYRALGRTADAQGALERHALYGARWPAIEDPVLTAVLAIRDDAGAYLQRGIRLADVGDVAGAIAAHEAALAHDPSLAQAHANLISLYGRAGDWARAEAHYRAAIARGLNLADAHYDYGVLLGLQEKWDPAAEAYRQALAVNPQHAPAHNNLGQILERRPAIDEAAAHYRQAVEIQPSFRLARFNLGRMLLAQGRAADAIVQFEQLLQPRDAEAPRYLFALATAHVQSGHKDAGIRWATAARQLALELGQRDLAAAIDRDLASLK